MLTRRASFVIKARRGWEHHFFLDHEDGCGPGCPAAARVLVDRGSVAVFTVIFALAVVFLLALILDGGAAMNARERAADIAGQAARAAADDIDLEVLRSTGHAVIAPGACGMAASLVARYARQASAGVDRVTSAALAGCSAPAGSGSATVAVTITTRPMVPGVFGGFTETAEVSAKPECGISQGGAC